LYYNYDDDYEYDSSDLEYSWEDETEKEFDKLFDSWLIEQIKPPEEAPPKLDKVMFNEVIKGGRKPVRNYSFGRTTTPLTTTTSTTTTPKPSPFADERRRINKNIPNRKNSYNMQDHGMKSGPFPTKIPKQIFKIRSPNKNLSMKQIEDLLKSYNYNMDNAEIQLVTSEEFDNKVAHTEGKKDNAFRPRPVLPPPPKMIHPYYPRMTTTVRPTATTSTPTSTTHKIFRPHKDTEKHEESYPDSFVYIGSHNQIFPGLYSDELFG
jgi:hypothetical protein